MCAPRTVKKCGGLQDDALNQHRAAVKDSLTFSADLLVRNISSAGEFIVTANFRHGPPGHEGDVCVCVPSRA